MTTGMFVVITGAIHASAETAEWNLTLCGKRLRGGFYNGSRYTSVEMGEEFNPDDPSACKACAKVWRANGDE